MRMRSAFGRTQTLGSTRSMLGTLNSTGATSTPLFGGEGRAPRRDACTLRTDALGAIVPATALGLTAALHVSLAQRCVMPAPSIYPRIFRSMTYTNDSGGHEG